jgi:uncharacterized protein YaaR (DUF327 family)
MFTGQDLWGALMKISEILKDKVSVPDLQNREDRKSVSKDNTSFFNHISDIEERSFDQKIQSLVSEIFNQGEKLSTKLDIGELKKYKSLISEFISQTLNNSYKFSKESFVDRRGRHKVYAAVKKINTELDGLTSDVISNEGKNIKILKRLIDIRGLIMDIIM